MDHFVLGSTHTVKHRVKAEELATEWGGDAPILSMAVLIGLVELASQRAVDEQLPGHALTLGTAFDIRHLAPTPVDHHVDVMAELIGVADGRLIFSIEGWDSEGMIVEGTHTRQVLEHSYCLRQVNWSKCRL